MRAFYSNPFSVFGGGLVVLMLLMAGLAPLLPLADPDLTRLDRRLLSPGVEGAMLGTDLLGRDILSRLVWGMRTSLLVALAATAIAAAVGSTIGACAGYFGRWVDSFLMRGVDLFMAFPYLVLALAIVAVLGPGLLNAMIAIAVVNIPFFARTVRGVTVGLIHLEFVEAARIGGASHAGILFRELLPNLLPTMIVTMATTLGWMILETAGLSFLGLGAQPPRADLGSMLADGRKLMLVHPHVALLPGAVIFLLVVGLNLVGDGLRDVLDPRLRGGEPGRPGAATKIGKGQGTKGEGRGATDPSEGDPAGTGSPRLPGMRQIGGGAPSPRGAEGHVLLGECHAPPLLKVENLHVHFGTGPDAVEAVRGVSFTLGRGESLGLVGESGSGKSATALAMLRLVPSPPGMICGGRISWDGRDIADFPLEKLRRLRGGRAGVVFQDPLSALNPVMRVGDQVVESIQAHDPMGSTAAMERAVKLFGEVGLPEPAAQVRAYPHQLSGGQRQRVCIALALANDPDCLIADEPTTALDVTVQKRILDLLARLRKERGLALLFISHDLGVVRAVCDRVMVMHRGRVVESGETRTVISNPAHPYTRHLVASIPRIGSDRRLPDRVFEEFKADA